MTYVVRRLKPKLFVFITTGTFNLLSKILTTLRLSGAVWIEADIAIGCPRTCAQRHSLSRPTVFSAFPRLLENSSLCQPLCFHPHIEPLIIVDSGCNSKSEPKSDRRIGHSGKSLLRKF
jgi:hypothetical protein